MNFHSPLTAQIAAASITILVLVCCIYMPGASGPFVFDDSSNFLSNTYVEMHEFSWEALKRAGYSVASGPLNRPVAMMSFALNHYFAGGYADTTPFKITNIAIHAINGLLVLWLVRLVLLRFQSVYPNTTALRLFGPRTPEILAFAVALLWALHPIQLTSVLYVVQRMTSLAALFTLLALICYLKGREQTLRSNNSGWILAAGGVVIFGLLGVLSKENAVLLPLFVLLLEATLFPHEWPWSWWPRLSPATKRILAVAAVVGTLVLLGAFVAYAAPRYFNRDFNAWERVLSEARALWLYISLIIVPRLNDFGLYHDDFIISRGLLSPWTTLPSVIGLVGLFVAAVLARKKYPLVFFGVLWFFTGHALESTVISLELVHEHRNYLPSLGILLTAAYGVMWAADITTRRKLLWVLPGAAVAFASVTTLRSMQWSNLNDLSHYEVLHHPDSASALTQLSVVLMQQHNYEEAFEITRRAAALDQRDALSYINLHIISAKAKVEIDPEISQETLRRLTQRPLTGSAINALENLGDCIHAACHMFQDTLETWTRAIIESSRNRGSLPTMYYVLGKTLAAKNKIPEAVNALNESFRLDPKYLHPRIELVQVYLREQKLREAQKALDALKDANRQNLHPRNDEIRQLEEALAGLKGKNA